MVAYWKSDPVLYTAREHHEFLVELGRRNGLLRSDTPLLSQGVRLLQAQPEKSSRQLSTRVRRRRVRRCGFAARRQCVAVCLSVCLSVTLMYCIVPKRPSRSSWDLHRIVAQPL